MVVVVEAVCTIAKYYDTPITEREATAEEIKAATKLQALQRGKHLRSDMKAGAENLVVVAAVAVAVVAVVAAVVVVVAWWWRGGRGRGRGGGSRGRGRGGGGSSGRGRGQGRKM